MSEQKPIGQRTKTLDKTRWNKHTVTCRGTRVTDTMGSRFDWLDLLGVSITISLDYNSSHSWLLLDNESLTVVWILHWPLVSSSLCFCILLSYSVFCSKFKVQSYVTTDGQPASLSWNKAPIWGLRPDLDYFLAVASLMIWGALSDERTGLPFAIATGPRQRSHFRVRVP
jgi:hypothetical protein